ncbi:MAG TPA: trigger factor [Thermomicrobiales bacterium]|nr:trigger factor [Thermomicrobiales bacterium]
MNVERMPRSTVSVDIFADEDEFAVAVDNAVKKIARDVTIPGFRRGKAPRHIIEGMIGREAIVEEAGRDMMDDLYRRAIEQESLVPISEPKVGILQDNPIGFNVQIEVFPSVTLGDYASARIEPREVDIEESEVEEVLDQLQKVHSEWIPVEEARSPVDGEQIVIDMEVYDGDEVFQPPATDSTFILGETPMFESVVEAIKMMTPGSTAELTLAFDEGDSTVNPRLWDKTLRYVVTLKQVNARVLAERDDELAAKSGSFGSYDDLVKEIHKDLLRNKATEAQSEVTSDVINAMAEMAVVDIPSAMVEKEIDDELTRFRSRLAQQGVDFNDYLLMNGQSEEELREEMRPNAERRIRNSLVLQEIAKAESIEATAEAIDEEIERLAGPSENPDRLRTLYQSEYFRGLLESEVFDRLLRERIVEIATEGKGAISGAGRDALEAARAQEETTRQQAIDRRDAPAQLEVDLEGVDARIDDNEAASEAGSELMTDAGTESEIVDAELDADVDSAETDSRSETVAAAMEPEAEPIDIDAPPESVEKSDVA